MSEVIVDSVKAKRVTLVNDKGEAVVSMCGDLGGGGIWLNRPNGDMITIFALEHQMGFGFYKASDVKDNKGMSLAFTLNSDGPYVMFRGKDNEPKFLSFEDLLAAASAHQTEEQQG